MAGILFIIVGMAIRIWAKRSLGDVSIVAVSSPNKLCTTGPYKYLKHPMYFGGMFNAFGFGYLLLGGVQGGIMATYIMLHFFLDRASREEYLLIQEFGDEYKKYIKGKII